MRQRQEIGTTNFISFLTFFSQKQHQQQQQPNKEKKGSPTLNIYLAPTK